MARVLILSSLVACGHVGLSAARPALERLGHVVTAVPTILLSNHPAFAHAAGAPVPPARMRAMIDALDANGWLEEQDAVLTGYLPSAAHVEVAAETVARLVARRPGLRVVVDPILGDHPKGLYLDPGASARLRDLLVPMAGTLTPNAFELGWLTGRKVDDAEAAIAAAGALALPRVIVTSAPFADGRTGILEVADSAVRAIGATPVAGVPQGTGDVLSGLVAAGLPLDRAMGHLSALVAASAGAPHLRLIEAAALWTAAPPARYDGP